MIPDPLQSLFVFGTSHHESPLAVRERFAFSEEDRRSFLERVRAQGRVRECLVLNTCNRLEIYGLADDPDVRAHIGELVCTCKGLSSSLLERHAFWHTNLAVLQHLFEVAAGLDSQVVGETEILGQLKQAYEAARSCGYTGKVLNRVFEKSFQAAKAARTQTGITRGQVSVGNIAVDLAARIFGRIDRSRVLLIGSGEVGEKTAQALKSRNVAAISVTSRTFETAHRLAHSLQGAAIDFADFRAQLHHYDILISCTSAPGLVLDRKTIAAAIARRPERPAFVIDLALPRDVEPALERMDNVYLYNLDDLSAIANENLELRRGEIEKARSILKAQAWTLWLLLRRRALAESLTSVR